MKIVNDERLVIKSWCNEPEDGAIDQARNMANLPFAFKHIALMPDTHQGYGMPIGGVLAAENVIIPNAVGVDIGCGMQAVQTNIHVDELAPYMLGKIMGKIRKVIPVGFKKHDKPQHHKYMPEPKFPEEFRALNIVGLEYRNAALSVGTLGGGNHFLEIQKDNNGYIWIMVHSGSRNLGKKIAEYYNKIAISLNEKWHSVVTKEMQLAFLPLNSEMGQEYYKEMNFALAFAKCNRTLMMERIKSVFCDVVNICELDFEPAIDIHHNYATMENHYGKNVMIHRKGATSAKDKEIGIIPGSQGTSSYIVRGKGNRDSFTSCSHGAGRKMSRKKAQADLDLEGEIKRLDDQGIIHGIRNEKDLDEASGAYKDIDIVMEEQKDLVDIVFKLSPLAVIKG